MTGGLLNAAMLLGLLGAALPVLIHLLNRRRDPLIDWGAMQFLDPGRQSRRRIRLTELLLMLARMGLLALVSLALARPFWMPAATADPPPRGGGLGAGADAPPRDVVLVLDGSDSMGRRIGGTSPRALAIQWARRFVARLRPGDSVAVLVAGDRVRPLIDPPSFDKARIDAALAAANTTPRGSSDLPAALAEAFRVLERTGNPGRDVIVLTDGQRSAWRPGEARRWTLVRDLQRRMPVPPRIWSLALGAETPSDAPNGTVGPLVVARSLVTPGSPIAVTTSLTNAGPGPLTRTAELLADGRPVPGSAQAVGPIPAGGRTPLSFRTTLLTTGVHVLAVRLAGDDDALSGDDEATVPVVVTAALPVLLVEGKPGLEPLSGATDFLRAALAPTGDDTPQVRATVIDLAAFGPRSLEGQSVAVLAGVDRLSGEQVAALGRFLDAGGGLLIAPGDRLDAASFNGLGWMPAKLGQPRGDPGARQAVAHPAPSTFGGPVLARFAEGDAPPLAEADLFAYHVLSPVAGASVSARLDNGDPWVVERPRWRGRVLVLAAPLDAAAGTLPVNPDFVPLAHEWVFHLAGGGNAPRVVGPGEPLVFDLDPPPGPETTTLPVQTPRGATARAQVVRESGVARARVDAESAADPGVYRLSLPDPPGGFAHASVAVDPESRARETDPTPLEPAEAARLAEGWPLAMETDPARLDSRLFAADRGGRRELWRGLVLAALAGLCLEIYLTRRLVRNQGLAAD